MFRGVMRYIPYSDYLVGTSNDAEKLDEIVDFKSKKYNPNNKHHVYYLQSQVRSCCKYYNNIFAHDAKHVMAPVSGEILFLMTCGMGYIAIIGIFLLLAYAVYYLISGNLTDRQELNDKFQHKLDSLLQLYEALIMQSATELNENKTTKNYKEISHEAETRDIDIIVDGEKETVTAIIDDNYLVPFGKKTIEYEIKDGENKRSDQKYIVDDEAIIDLVRFISGHALSEELIKPIVKYGLDQTEISDTVLRILSEPPNQIVLCSTKSTEHEPNFIIPANSFSQLIKNYHAHTKRYFYGHSNTLFFPRNLQEKVDEACDYLSNINLTVNAIKKQS